MRWAGAPVAVVMAVVVALVAGGSEGWPPTDAELVADSCLDGSGALWMDGPAEDLSGDEFWAGVGDLYGDGAAGEVQGDEDCAPYLPSVDEYVLPLDRAYFEGGYSGNLCRPHHDGRPAIDINSSSTGVDIEGAEIRAITSGTVEVREELDRASWGWSLVIVDDNGVAWNYGHGVAGSLLVHEGDEVDAGDPLMALGNTGISTGPHLHLGIFLEGTRVGPGVPVERLEPQPLLQAIYNGEEIDLNELPRATRTGGQHISASWMC